MGKESAALVCRLLCVACECGQRECGIGVCVALCSVRVCVGKESAALVCGLLCVVSVGKEGVLVWVALCSECGQRGCIGVGCFV